mmetsp:Transcript_25700/g.73367  ORF Transcript_25700/g.73367 Transcript_25700/m.73367 type:complete len:84 (-) Transcript_25700:13-264(-)
MLDFKFTPLWHIARGKLWRTLSPPCRCPPKTAYRSVGDSPIPTNALAMELSRAPLGAMPYIFVPAYGLQGTQHSRLEISMCRI